MFAISATAIPSNPYPSWAGSTVITFVTPITCIAPAIAAIIPAIAIDFNIEEFTFIPAYSAPNLLNPTALSSNPKVVFANINAIMITIIIDITIPQFTLVAGPTKPFNQSMLIFALSFIGTDVSLLGTFNHEVINTKLLR